MNNLVVLISGRGSNMEAIVRACRAERWPAAVRAVIADRADAPGLARARALDVPAEAVARQDHPTREAFDAALAERVAAHAPDWVALAGFMRILGAPFVQRFAGRLVNIHPSLLPAFAGLHTHRRALAAGVRAHGATVHFVAPALDAGPILAQAVVPVLDGDDEAALAARVLAAEHRLYPAALRWLVEGRLRGLDDGRVRLEGVPPAERLLLPAASA